MVKAQGLGSGRPCSTPNDFEFGQSRAGSEGLDTFSTLGELSQTTVK